VLAWEDDPEQQYQQAELRALVEHAVTSLPLPYRMAVLLRDLEQLSTAEAAAALGLGVPTLKTHLLRGRLMLREALAPHFVRRTGATTGV
jgi:RNA polymerase sigma-70 factor (ECF subfamily)